MAEHEINAKLNVDTTQLDEAIEKVKQLKEALWVVSGLIEELADENAVDITTTITMDNKVVRQGVRNSQLAKEFEVMDARIKGRLNRNLY